MHTLKDFIAAVLLFSLAAICVITVERAVNKAFYDDKAPEIREPEAESREPAVVTPVLDDDSSDEPEFNFEQVLAREMAHHRQVRAQVGRDLYLVGFAIKAFGKPFPIRTVGAFANSFGSQLMVNGLVLREQISPNPLIAFGQGFIIGL
jgi:hypothetical protein